MNILSISIILIVAAISLSQSVSAIDICDYSLPNGVSEKQIRDAYKTLKDMVSSYTELEEWVEESLNLFDEEISEANDYNERERVLDRHLIRACTIYGMV